MTDFTPIANLPVAVDDLASAATAQALRDNPVAIAEGAQNAPKVVPAALGSPLLARAQVTDIGVLPGAVTIVDLTDLDRIGIVKIDTLIVAKSSVTFYLDLSADAGATWYTWSTTFVTGSPKGPVFVDLIAATVDRFFGAEGPDGHGTYTFPSAAQGANRLRLRADDQIGNIQGNEFYGLFWAMSGKP